MKMIFASRQNGSALIVALSILLVLTILGVSSMRNISLEEKMAGNARDAQVAFEAAEAALREAEIYLDGIANKADFGPNGGIGGYYTGKGNNAEAWTVEANWAAAHQVTAAEYAGNNEIAQQPRYIIQVVEVFSTPGPNAASGYGGPPTKTFDYYQITARGFGVSPNSRVMLQTYYATFSI